MAVATNVQTESVAFTQNNVQWTDNTSPAQAPTVQRAPHGGAFANLATLAAGVTTFQDTTAVAGTFYDYRISQTDGLSAISSVVTQTCTSTAGIGRTIFNPNVTDPVTAAQLQQLIQDLNAQLGGTAHPDRPCVLCPTNQAIVLDCAVCNHFTVTMTSDINSISMINCGCNPADITIGCNELVGSIDFITPTGGSFRLCGWPTNFGNDGGECFAIGPVTGPSRMNVPFRKTATGPIYNPPAGSGGSGLGGGGGGCSCVAGVGGALAMVCCDSGGLCSMNCQTKKSLQLQACGGTQPYTWSTTKGTLSSTTGSFVTLTPTIANTSTDTTSQAYITYVAIGTDCTTQGIRDWETRAFSCGDVQLVACQHVVATSPCCPNTCWTSGPGSSQFTITCTTPAPTGSGCGGTVQSMLCFANATQCVATRAATVCDIRTQAMVNAGCVPCGLMDGAVVTVTDFNGVSVSKTVRGSTV